MDFARLEFPAHDGIQRATSPAWNPGTYEEAWRVNFQIFAVHAKRGTVCLHADAGPFAAWPQVGGAIGDSVHALLAPPLGHLVRVCNGLEDTLGGRGNKDFGDHRVLILRDCDRCHGSPVYFSTNFLSSATKPGQPWQYPVRAEGICDKPLCVTYTRVPF